MIFHDGEIFMIGHGYESLLDSGKFEVYKCYEKRKDDENVMRALKLVMHGGSKDGIEEAKLSLRRELESLMRTQSSQHIVDLVGIIQYEYWSGIVLEYLPAGNLCDCLRKYKPSFWLRLRIINDVAQGIHFLHQKISTLNDISHNDLKPQNVLLDKDFRAKICDFEGSDIISRTSGLESFKTWRCITSVAKNYTAPEVQTACYNSIGPEAVKIKREKAMDIFSFAMIIYFTLTRKHPLDEIDSCVSRNQLFMKGYRPKMPGKYDFSSTPEANDALGKLIEQMKHCWRQDPR